MDATSSTPAGDTNLVELAADIVSAYVTKNSVRTTDLSDLISTVHSALKSVGQPAPAEPAKPEPAVSIKKSITPDYLISLFDGKRYKSLKRHLRTSHDMTPEQYRTYWELPRDYPMVAPNYAAARSELAKAAGLGQKGGARKKAAAKRRK
jgi:predicted transcriptional regulator